MLKHALLFDHHTVLLINVAVDGQTVMVYKHREHLKHPTLDLLHDPISSARP